MSITHVHSQVNPNSLIHQKLPKEVFTFVLGYLNTGAVNQARLVSKDWYNANLLAIKELQSVHLEKLISLVPSNSEQFDQMKKKISLSTDFLGMRELILKMRDELVVILKPLSKDELKSKEEFGVNFNPNFFGKTFKLTQVCKLIDDFETLSIGERKGIVDDLVGMKMFEKAIDVTKKIKDEGERQLCFIKISKGVTLDGKFERAIDTLFINSIEANDPMSHMAFERRDQAIIDVAIAMGRSGLILQAKKAIDDLKNFLLRDKPLCLIHILDLCHQDKWKDAEDWANTSNRGIYKSDGYQEIAMALCRADKWEKSIEIASAIPSREVSMSCLEFLSKQLEHNQVAYVRASKQWFLASRK